MHTEDHFQLLLPKCVYDVYSTMYIDAYIYQFFFEIYEVLALNIEYYITNEKHFLYRFCCFLLF